MKGKVLFCDKVSFTGQDGNTVSGFRIGVFWRDYKGERHCLDTWSRRERYEGEFLRVVYSKDKKKYFFFDWDADDEI